MSLTLRNHFEEVISLTDKEFEYALSFFVKRKFRKHQFIIQAGNDVKHEYFVEKGLLKSYYTNIPSFNVTVQD